MIGMSARFQFQSPKVLRAVNRANVRGLGHAGAGIRLRARRSIRRSESPSQPGHPPHTRKGQLKRALLYAVERSDERVVVGPTYEIVGRSAMAHEFGGRYRRERYPKRPLMGPALIKHMPRIPKHWRASVR